MRLPPAVNCTRLNTVDSTNLEARRRFEQGELGPLWIWADDQTAGRGRLGRSWQSPRGNLYATCLWRENAPLSAASQVGFVAALAVHDAVSRLKPDAALTLKWPNDVLLDGAKFCGLLAEALNSDPLVMAMGFGINLRSAPVGLPYATAKLGDSITPEQMLEQLASAFDSRLRQWQSGAAFAEIREAWCTRSYPLGAALAVDGRNGNFAGLAHDGALLLELGGQISPFHAGDVRVMPVSS